MKKLIAILAGAVAIASLVLVIGCGSEQSQTDTAVQQKPATSQTTDANTNADAVKPYPLNYCIVSGEELGSMGDAVVKVYQGHEVKFCCNHCVRDFEANIPMYLAKIDSAATAGGHMEGMEGMEGHEGHEHGG